MLTVDHPVKAELLYLHCPTFIENRTNDSAVFCNLLTSVVLVSSVLSNSCQGIVTDTALRNCDLWEPQRWAQMAEPVLVAEGTMNCPVQTSLGSSQNFSSSEEMPLNLRHLQERAGAAAANRRLVRLHKRKVARKDDKKKWC